MVDPVKTIMVAFVFSLIIVALFRFMRSQIRRQEARYALYRVRDDLIGLVAADKLDEEDRVFSYYYKRINSSLESIPVYGLDQALVAYIRYKDSDSFRKRLDNERKETEQLLKDISKLDPAVRTVIVDFYSANKKMLLAHSSLIRILYVILSTGWIPSLPVQVRVFARRLIFKRIVLALEFLNFADRRVNQFQKTI